VVEGSGHDTSHWDAKLPRDKLLGMTTIRQSDIPALTAAEMAAVDRAMFDVCRLDVLQVMEVAGRSIARWVRSEIFGGFCTGRRVLVLCGPGGNGGDGLVAARYLFGWAAEVTVVLSKRPAEGTVTAHQLRIAETLGVPVVDSAMNLTLTDTDLIVDGVLGFSSRGAPRGVSAMLIEQANAQTAQVISIDLPSGLDATTGAVHAPCVRASATITLGLPKTGLLVHTARDVVGRIVVADIGIPTLAFRAAGIAPPQVSWNSDWLQLAE